MAQKYVPFQEKDVSVERVKERLTADREKRAEASEEWLKSPYLNVPLETATVGELTTAFEQWLKAHPEEMVVGSRHKDDEVVKFQRRLYRMQLDNDLDEVPVNIQEKLDAFIQQENQSQPDLVMGFTNPDGNWKLLGPVTNPQEIPYSEPAFSPEKSADNAGLGRINCIEFSNWDPRNIWVGTSTGGIWKTFNGGQSWINISMNLPIMEISDIAIDQSNSNVIYLATGDRDGQGGPQYGNGVSSRLYKTTDGGNNWFPINANFGTGTFIMNLWVHPQRPWEVVVVKRNGIYKSNDGGGTWTQTVVSNFTSPYTPPNNTYFEGAAYANLANPERIYSAYSKYYPNEGRFVFYVQKSDDFGKTWLQTDSVTTAINDPTYSPNYARLAVAPSDANCLYVVSTEYDTTHNADRFGCLFRTLDGGKTWQNRSRYPDVSNILGWLMGDENDIGSQSSYDLVLTVDPKNKDRVFVDGVDSWGSTNGGETFDKTTFWLSALGESAHADHHWGEYQPISGTYFLATDGGLYKTDNLTPGNNKFIAGCFSDTAYNYFSQNCYQFPTKWEYAGNGISNNEFYAIAVSKSDPSIVMGGAQDNGTMIRRNGQWYSVFGGDGFTSMIHPSNPNIFYVTVYNGYTWRTTDGGQTYRFISIAMDSVDGGAWLTPMEMSATNPNIIVQARDKNLWRTTNGGNSWSRISNFTVGVANQATALAIAPSNSNIIYAARRIRATATSAIQYFLNRTTDGGATWQNVWSTAFPPNMLTDIAIHPTQPNKIWVTFSVGYSATNTNQVKKVFYSADGGLNWTNISAGLPLVPAFTVAVEENSPIDAVYVGTGVGVFYRDNTMSQFVEFQVGMPRGVMATDLKIHATSGKIFAGTYGRGIWSANLRDQPYDGGAQAMKINRSLLLTVSPNPAHSEITVDWDAKQIEGQRIDVLDLFGRTLFSKKDFSGKAQFNMSTYSEGTYMIQLKTGKEVVTKKFVLAK